MLSKTLAIKVKKEMIGFAIFFIVAGCCTSLWAAVPRVSPSKSHVQSTTDTDAGDDWFAEIDDMIQDMAAQVAPIDVVSDQLLVKSVPQKKIIKKKPVAVIAQAPVKKRPVLPAPTPTNLEQEQTKNSSIIQEILRSDYWLEDSKPAPVKQEKPEAAVREMATPKPLLSTDDELLAMERELLRDLTMNQTKTATPEPPETPSAPQEEDQPAAGSVVEMDARQLINTQNTRRPHPDEEEEMNALEASLMAELDEFATPEPTAAPATKTPPVIVQEETTEADETDALVAELIEEELTTPPATPTATRIETQPEPEVDAALELAEQTHEPEPTAHPPPEKGIEKKVPQEMVAPTTVTKHEKLELKENQPAAEETTPHRKAEKRQLVAIQQKKFLKQQEKMKPPPPPVKKQYKMNIPMVSMGTTESATDTSVFMMISPSEETHLRKSTPTPSIPESTQNATAIIPSGADDLDSSIPLGW